MHPDKPPTDVDRRAFLIRTCGWAATAALAPGAAASTTRDAAARSPASAPLSSLLEHCFQEQMRLAPQTMTSLGLDTGAGDWARSRLNDSSRQHTERMIRM